MAKVDELTVQINADTKDLEESLRRSSKSLATLGFHFKEVNKSAGSSSKPLSTSGLAIKGFGIAAAAAAAGLVAFNTAMLKLNEAQGISLMSKRLGLSSEQMQKFGFAARVSGVDTNTLADAMKDLTIKIKDASIGATSYEEAFNLIGLKSKELLSLPVDKQFLAFADAISKADAATRRFVLSEINDSMFDLLPLMEKGSKGFDEMGERAKKLGVVLSDTALKEMDKALTKINEMNAAWDSMITKIVSKLAPKITAMINEMDKIASSQGGGASSRVHGFGSEENIVREHNKRMQSRSAMGSSPVGLGVTGGESREESDAYWAGGFAMDDSIMRSMEGGGASDELKAAAEYAAERQDAIEAAILESKQRAQVLWMQTLQENMEAETRIAKEKADAELKIERQKEMAKKQMLQNLSSLMNTESRKMFEVGKAAAIAQSVMNTYQGVTKALADVPYPYNFVAAATVLAAGLNNVNNIRSTQFGSAGGGAASTGGAAGLGSDGSTTAAPSVQQTTNVDVTLMGDNFSGDQVRGLIGQINDATSDNVKLNAVMAR
jgi:hypothetical protein